MYDVIIIGAGMSGVASVRELSRHKVSACVLEWEKDMCCGTSKANSTIVHVGYDTAEGSLMARPNVEGSQAMSELAKELDSPFNPCGSLVVCLDGEPLPDLRALHERGVKNGVEDLEIITDKVRIKEMEPDLVDEVAGVLYVPTTDIVYPFNLNIALAKNAYTNSVDFKFNTEVTDICRIESGWALEADRGVYETRCVVNVAGVHADKFHDTVSETRMCITPRRGDYCLLDKNTGNHVSRIILTFPSKYGKGVLAPPTVCGSLIVGSTAIDIENKEATATTREGLDELIAKAGMNVKDLSTRQAITFFAGLRTHEGHHEFIIKELEDTPGSVDCTGIESSGLTSCSTIGGMVAGILKEKLELGLNTQFNGSQKGILDPDALTEEKQAELVKQNPAYGNIMCRCGVITEGEILDAIHRPLGVCSLDGIKRRTRTGMGRCQAGFCTSKSIGLLHRELGLPMMEVTKTDGDSRLIVGTNKDRIQKGARVE